VHLSIGGWRIKTVPSRLSAVDLARLRRNGARPAGPPPAGNAPGALAADSCVEVQRLVNAAGIITLGNQGHPGRLPAGRTASPAPPDGLAAAHCPARRAGYGAAPPAPRVLRIALRDSPAGCLDPGDLCGPWRQEERGGRPRPAPRLTRGAQTQRWRGWRSSRLSGTTAQAS